MTLSFKIIPETLHDVEVVVLEGSFGPDFTDDFGEGGPKVKDNVVRMDAPIIELSQKSFGDAATIEPGSRLDIEDSALESISSYRPPPIGMYSSIERAPENWSWLRISRKSYSEARRCFHRSTVDLDPVVLKLRNSLLAIRLRVLLSSTTPATASEIRGCVARWYRSMPRMGRLWGMWSRGRR